MGKALQPQAIAITSAARESRPTTTRVLNGAPPNKAMQRTVQQRRFASNVGRFLAAVWASACTAILVLAYIQREIHDMPEAVLWLTIFLTFPAGLIVIIVAWWISYLLPDSGGLSPIQHFWAVVPYWATAVVLGYLQWFVAVPKLWQKFTKAKVI